MRLPWPTKLFREAEAEAALTSATERYGRSGDRDDLAELRKWIEAAEFFRREAGEFRAKAELLRQHIA